MKLIYRGTTYNYNPTNAIDDVSSENNRVFGSIYKLMYRSCSYLLNSNTGRQNSVQPTTYKLIYRGSTYEVNRNECGELTAIAL